MKRLRAFASLTAAFITFMVAGCGGGGVSGTENKLTGQWIAEKLNAQGDRILLVFNEAQISAPPGGFNGPDPSATPPDNGPTVRVVAVRPQGDAVTVDTGTYSIKDSRVYFSLSTIAAFNSPYTVSAGTSTAPGLLTLGAEKYFQMTGDPTAGPQLGGQIQISKSATDNAVTTASFRRGQPYFIPGEVLVNNTINPSSGMTALEVSGSSSTGGSVPPFSVLRLNIDDNEAVKGTAAALTLKKSGSSSKDVTSASVPERLISDVVTEAATRQSYKVSKTIEYVASCNKKTPGKCALNVLLHTQAAGDPPNDQYYADQWGMDAIDATDAWGTVATPASGVTPADTVVAVIDTGIVSNPDLDDHILKKADGTYVGYDFVHDKINGVADLDLDTTAKGGFTPSALDKPGPDPDPTDPGDGEPLLPEGSSWHGTHIAGIIAADTNNGTGVAGIAPRAKIMPLRAMGAGGNGSLASVAQAIYYAAGLPNIGECGPYTDVSDGNGDFTFNASTWTCTPDGHPKAKVINLSLGGIMDASSAGILNAAINAADAAGVLVVAAAGNDSIAPGNKPVLDASGNITGYTPDDTYSFYPAANPAVVAVSAVYPNLAFASAYSNFGKDGNNPIDIAAPGGSSSQGILSTVHPSTYGKYGMLTGTSQAAAFVSGVAALVWSDQPSLTKEQVRSAILTSAIDLGTAGVDNNFGNGLISACGAVAKGRQLAGHPIAAGAGALKLSVDNVNFGSLGAQQTLLINGGCGTSATIAKAIKTSGTGWLTMTFAGSNTTPSALQLSVKRDGLAPGDYTSTVTIQASDGSSKTVNVAMTVGTNSVSGATGPTGGTGDVGNQINNFLTGGTTSGNVNTTDIGEVILLLIDSTSGNAMYYTKTDFTADYNFQFGGFNPGTYYILGGVDTNGDGKICVAGETEPCFSYPNVADPQAIAVDATTKQNTLVIQY